MTENRTHPIIFYLLYSFPTGSPEIIEPEYLKNDIWSPTNQEFSFVISWWYSGTNDPYLMNVLPVSFLSSSLEEIIRYRGSRRCNTPSNRWVSILPEVSDLGYVGMEIRRSQENRSKLFERYWEQCLTPTELRMYYTVSFLSHCNWSTGFTGHFLRWRRAQRNPE